MKYGKYTTYPKLRREYGTAEEMAEVIFRTPGYIYARLNGDKEFTYREKVALLTHIGRSAEDVPEFFPEKAVAV